MVRCTAHDFAVRIAPCSANGSTPRRADRPGVPPRLRSASTLVPWNPAYLAQSQRIPLIPVNPTCPGESHLSQRIPLGALSDRTGSNSIGARCPPSRAARPDNPPPHPGPLLPEGRRGRTGGAFFVSPPSWEEGDRGRWAPFGSRRFRVVGYCSYPTCPSESRLPLMHIAPVSRFGHHILSLRLGWSKGYDVRCSFERLEPADEPTPR